MAPSAQTAQHSTSSFVRVVSSRNPRVTFKSRVLISRNYIKRRSYYINYCSAKVATTDEKFQSVYALCKFCWAPLVIEIQAKAGVCNDRNCLLCEIYNDVDSGRALREHYFPQTYLVQQLVSTPRSLNRE